MWQHCGIRIFVLESDFYARQAISSYLSWDRRTRVVGMVGSIHEMIAVLDEESEEMRLNAVTLNADLASDPAELAGMIKLIHNHLPEARVICLAGSASVDMALSALHSGAAAYLTREAVGAGVASSVRFTLQHEFTITEDLADAFERHMVSGVCILPGRRLYTRLTPRIEQALWLCVVEGLPAERAAEEMGVSISTIRSYIKEGYRILEAEDDTAYPLTASPAERAFLRFTALEADEEYWEPTPWRPAA